MPVHAKTPEDCKHLRNFGFPIFESPVTHIESITLGSLAGLYASHSKSDILCPYCKVALDEATSLTMLVRVVKITGDCIGLVEVAPEGQRALKCSECESRFTLPKGGGYDASSSS
jgi:hypothetical protein